MATTRRRPQCKKAGFEAASFLSTAAAPLAPGAQGVTFGSGLDLLAGRCVMGVFAEARRRCQPQEFELAKHDHGRIVILITPFVKAQMRT
jgi:hypothetical protein